MEKIEFVPNGNIGTAVSARSLHEFLEVKSKFIDWIKNRINKYDFIENQDFISISKNLENGGREIDYALTIDTAKELSMVEGNEKGKQARKYFIECEKQVKHKPLTTAEMFLQNAQILVEHESRITYLEDFTAKKFEETFTKIDEIKAFTSTRPEYFTIAAYAAFIKVSVNNKKAKELGYLASKLCRERNLSIEKVPDNRWGNVNSYPLSILKEVFSQAA